ncbi:MAG: site-2 protease family protein [Deltaproteobacteria bacterium]|jgi:Zn-dependent protease|nr:site-2 protease family protein [Deltaproteobacteria bacterium]MBW2535641.1 site-2 protease family protein [Deltaproteobacteria bacterium]
MRFRLFGIPIEVQAGFWIMAVALRFTLLAGEHKAAILVWVAAVFLSILVHEFGHAIAVIRYGAAPSITLHMLGGVTSWRTPLSLQRYQRIIISAAGPAAGFLLAALVFGFKVLSPNLSRELPFYVAFALDELLWINVAWGIFNLIPVLPFDGGHILQEAMGPKRARAAALVSLVTGISIALLFLVGGFLWGTFLVGLGAVQSYQRFQSEADEGGGDTGGQRPSPRAQVAKPVEDDRPVPPEIADEIALAREALADDDYEKAGTIAEQVLSQAPPLSAQIQALHLIGWAHLLLDRPDQAARVLAALEQLGEIDKALAAAVLRAQGNPQLSRQVLEAARAEGDDRKEIVGPLIQILIEQGEVGRAAAIALDIVDSLSEDDARQMVTIASEAGSYPWASRLSEAVFERTGQAEDAYHAARNRALEGDEGAALILLRRAVAAGFSDAARAWSDAALEKLHGVELEALLPPPLEQ